MVMARILIATGIVVISTIIGMRKSKKYENREYILRESITFFRGMENEIKYMLSTIPNAIEGVRQNLNTMLKPILGAISTDILMNNVSSSKIAMEIDRLDPLSAYDRQIISNGIISLGQSDVDGQIGVIQNTLSILENQVTEANVEKNKNSKLYRTVGIVAGLMIAIIFI